MEKDNPTATKEKLAYKLAKIGISRNHSRQIVDCFFTQLAQSLRRCEVVNLVGFGSFHYKIRAARKGRNPRTGQSVQVPAKRVIQFRPGGRLKSMVRKPEAKET